MLSLLHVTISAKCNSCNSCSRDCTSCNSGEICQVISWWHRTKNMSGHQLMTWVRKWLVMNIYISLTPESPLTGGLNIGQLPGMNQTRGWWHCSCVITPIKMVMMDGEKNCNLSWNWSSIKGENPQINQRMMICGGLENYLDISLIQIKA